MSERDVYGLYRESWQGEIVEDAFAHPAKFARGLIRFIYQHAIAQGYIAPGDTVMDPFGGVGLGALDAMRHGLHWRGVELEERFVGLGQDNIVLWNERYAAAFPAWGTAQLIQGDSRRLESVLQEAGACVSSPPFSNQLPSHDNFVAPHDSTERMAVDYDTAYGRTEGQLGAMPEGDAGAVLSSPPYASGEKGHPSLGSVNKDEWGKDGRDIAGRRGVNGRYGNGNGQLSNMPEGEADGVVSSPPFENGIPQQDKSFVAPHDSTLNLQKAVYGATNGNIGNDTGDTFWTAARAIVEQVHAVLRPGGVAIWVCGDFVRQGERVYFGRQWMQLCEACGFEPVEWIRAWKREPGPTQLALVGEDKDHTIDRVSFFRRLANKRNPDAAILNEDVIIMRRMP